MKIDEIITEQAVSRISKQQAIDQKMFGPVYHGSSEEGRAAIAQSGFKIHGQDDIGRSNGFDVFTPGYPGVPPVHLLGYGVYFTPSPSVGKKYNAASMKGIAEYYLDVPRLTSIGFQSVNTMWRWWVQHGYNFDPKLAMLRNQRSAGAQLMAEQHRATKHMTEVLASQYDGVYLRPSRFRRGVDDTQICIYDPQRIYQVDKSLAGGWDIGAVVTHNQRVHYSPAFIQEHGLLVEKQPNGWTFVLRVWEDGRRTPLIEIPPPGLKGTIVSKNETKSEYMRTSIDPRMLNQASHWISVKWQKGGTKHNYVEAELDPIVARE